IAWSIFICVVVIGTVCAWWWLADWITHGWTRVPTPLFGGASQWTTTVVDWAVILTAIVLVVRGQRKLYDNAESVRREFGFEKSVRELVQIRKCRSGCGNVAWRCSGSRSDRCRVNLAWRLRAGGSHSSRPSWRSTCTAVHLWPD